MSFGQRAPRALRAFARRHDRPTHSTPPQDVGASGGAWQPTGGSAPGSRIASMFFEKYPRFYETSKTYPKRDRLNLRYEAIFAENRDLLVGAKVLDLASHDGRWSLAALETGAAQVVGIEARPDLVAAAGRTLDQYGYGSNRVRFVSGDVHEALARQDFDVDVVLCLGFLYHTLRYNELLSGIRRTKARGLIIDTYCPQMMRSAPYVYIRTDDAEKQGKATADTYTCGSSVLVGLPNLAAIQAMLAAYGYQIERLSDWDGLLRDNPKARFCGDYARHHRITIRCTDTSTRAAEV